MVDTARSQTLDRGLAVLELIGHASGPLTVPEIAAELGFHRSIVYRLVRTLEDRHFVSRDGEAYRVGFGVLALRNGVATDLASVARPGLQDLADRLGFAAFVVARVGDEAIVPIVVEPTDPPHTFTLRIGRRHPVAQGAPGRALLMYSPAQPDEDPRLRVERERGWAYSHGEIIEGVTSVAVPLYAHPTPAAVCVTSVGEWDVEAAAAATLATAERIDAALAARREP